jgi:hypothetical protein
MTKRNRAGLILSVGVDCVCPTGLSFDEGGPVVSAALSPGVEEAPPYGVHRRSQRRY